MGSLELVMELYWLEISGSSLSLFGYREESKYSSGKMETNIKFIRWDLMKKCELF